MAKYNIVWEALVERSVSIEADSEEEAFKKWQSGDYNTSDLEVNDEDINGESIEIDNVEYYANKFERVVRGSGNLNY